MCTAGILSFSQLNIWNHMFSVNVSRKYLLCVVTPNAILSDRGTDFESEQFQTFCSERGTRKLGTMSYNPKGNSICERFNKTFKFKIFQVLTPKCLNKSRWFSCIDLVFHDYRFSVHSTTSYRPVDLFRFQMSRRLAFQCL